VLVGQIANLFYENSIIVTDENVAKFHLEKTQLALQVSGIEPKSVIIPAGEEHKNLETVSFLWKSFLEHGLDRKSTVIALGGGVIGDLSGFAASTYMRGIAWVGVPTTLLSMVDASLGGKTGFDLPEGKNLIGSFYPPKLVLADPSLLLTLPEVELISGMAEVVKHGVISDPKLFNLCGRGLHWVKDNLEEIVKRAMAVKIKVIEEDPYEKGIRAALNLGHTVGHAIELALPVMVWLIRLLRRCPLWDCRFVFQKKCHVRKLSARCEWIRRRARRRSALRCQWRSVRLSWWM
jgi:3-dehydroquinate synthetase